MRPRAVCPWCGREVSVFVHPDDLKPRLFGHRVSYPPPSDWCRGGGQLVVRA